MSQFDVDASFMLMESPPYLWTSVATSTRISLPTPTNLTTQEDSMAQDSDYAPKLGAGLSLLNLFGLTSTSAQIFAAVIAALILGCFFVHFRYPCRSPAPLTKVVDDATNLYNKCLDMRAFDGGEYGKFTLLLHRVTARASQIAARIYPESTERSRCRESLEWILFVWTRLKDTVECHRQVQLLIRDLENMNSRVVWGDLRLHVSLVMSMGLLPSPLEIALLQTSSFNGITIEGWERGGDAYGTVKVLVVIV
ncbi:hypothetical protein L218DRAFT_949894 [Marasmius fiardii PR-910]|nr:hypothetical protein L218DRAFT_949894 [Marasmius fiardii PR-910]